MIKNIKIVFLSLSIIALGIYAIDNPENVEPKTFRRLVAMIVLSWVYDLVSWICIRDETAKRDFDGESWVRKVSYFCFVTSVYFRIVVIIVFWKDSLDFKKILDKPLDLPESLK